MFPLIAQRLRSHFHSCLSENHKVLISFFKINYNDCRPRSTPWVWPKSVGFCFDFFFSKFGWRPERMWRGVRPRFRRSWIVLKRPSSLVKEWKRRATRFFLSRSLLPQGASPVECESPLIYMYFPCFCCGVYSFIAVLFS